MVKFGTKINPLLEVLPPGEEISEDQKENFKASIREHAKALGLEQ